MPDAPSLRDHVSAAEWQTRLDLACAYRLVAHHGWDDLIFTHLSARVPGPEAHFLINPLGMMFAEITASSLVKVDHQGVPVDKTSAMINPAGFIIHSCIHAARSDVQAVFHTHTVAGVAVSAQAEGLLPLSQTALSLYTTLAYHDYEGIALSADEQPRLVADLGDKRALILRHHGLLTAGRSVAEAYLLLFMLEKACAIQIAAQGAPLVPLPQSMVNRVADQAAHSFEFAAQLAWHAAVRAMQRLDPEFAR